jgi:hypothetical protein
MPGGELRRLLWRASWLALCLACRAGAAEAHDFWIQPSGVAHAPGDTVTLALMVGHGDERQQSPIAPRRIRRFDAVAPDGRWMPVVDRVFRPDSPGVHALVLQTDSSAQSHLPAPLFNAYLYVDGLRAVQAHRERYRLHGEPGAERYSRVAKALVEVGAPAHGARAGCAAGGPAEACGGNAIRVFGLPLELVPERSPFGGGERLQLPVRVLYKGQPLPGSLVKLTDLARDDEPVAAARADGQGRVEFTVPRRGNWLLNVVWSEPVQRGDGIDYETVFSSLVWDNSARDEEESPHRGLP